MIRTVAGSSDEEQCDCSDVEDAIAQVVGPFGPWPPGQPPADTLENVRIARRKVSRCLHFVESEEGTHFKCGRKLSEKYELLCRKPDFVHPACAICLPQ